MEEEQKQENPTEEKPEEKKEEVKEEKPTEGNPEEKKEEVREEIEEAKRKQR